MRDFCRNEPRVAKKNREYGEMNPCGVGKQYSKGCHEIEPVSIAAPAGPTGTVDNKSTRAKRR